MGFRLRNVPLLSRVGADRSDNLRTDIDAAVAGWVDAALIRVDSRNQVMVSAAVWCSVRPLKAGDRPPSDAVFLGHRRRPSCLGGACAVGSRRGF